MTKVQATNELNALGKDALIVKLQRAQARIAMLERLHFGTKSERHVPLPVAQGELGLFDEAEQIVAELKPEVVVEDSEPEAEQSRKDAPAKPGRKKLPEHLVREIIRHELEGIDCQCPCCGKDRPRIGEEITEELEIIPAKAVVHQHVRATYGECTCAAFAETGQTPVIKAPGPRKIVAGSQFSNHSIANFITAKFVDGLPFYRQETITERAGFRVSRQTMAHLATRVGSAVGPLIELMVADTRLSPVLRMDETTVQVLKEKNRAPQSKSYAWVSYGYKDHRPIVIFRYNPSRSSEVAHQILEGFKGFLQTDGYGGYNTAGRADGVIHVGCWAHIRREFKKALDVAGGHDDLATAMLEMIAELYELETSLRMKLVEGEIAEAEFCATRTRKALRILSRIELWLEQQAPRVTPHSDLGKAISYACGQFEKAKRYHEHLLLTPDNNPIERTIRPFVTGRKNWLFADTALGAHASMSLYTLVMSAKANGLDPAGYLTMLFDELPGAHKETDLRALLPYEYAKNQGITPGGYFPTPDEAPAGD